MSLQNIAQELAAKGRGPDTMLVHMAPEEVAGLQLLAEEMGTTLTVNPETGLPEAFNLFALAVGALAAVATGGASIPLMMAASAGAGGLAGLATKEEGQSGLQAFLGGAMSGLGGAGVGGLASGALGGLGAGAAGAGEVGALTAGEALAGAAGTGAEGAIAAGMTQAEILAAQSAGMGVDAAVPLAQEAAAASAYGADGLASATGNADTWAQMGEGMASDVGSPAYEAAMQEALAENAASGQGMAVPDNLTSLDVYSDPWEKAQWWWKHGGGKGQVDKGMKAMGQVNKALGGGGQKAPQYAPAAPNTPYVAQNVAMPQAGGGGGFAPQWARSANAPAPGSSMESPMARQRRLAYQQAAWTAAEGGLVALAEGGTVDMASGGFVIPADVVSAIGNGSTEAGLGALEAIGAQEIEGPGDGQSDDIEATIDGAPVARVADGEAYLSPQAVAALGNGDQKRGAKRLYTMLDRVRQQAYGHTEQIRPVSLEKALA